MYLSQIAKCVLSPIVKYLSQIENAGLTLLLVSGVVTTGESVSTLQNVYVSNCKLCLSQIAKCICFKLQNVFFSNCQMYLSQIAITIPVVGGWVVNTGESLSFMVSFSHSRW